MQKTTKSTKSEPLSGASEKKQPKQSCNDENLDYLAHRLDEEQLTACSKALDALAGGKSLTEKQQKAFDLTINSLNEMERFGENRWWTSDDLRVVSYYQFMSPVMLVPFPKFHEAAEFLLQRPILTHEFAQNWDGMKAEAEKAFSGKQQ
jgi:hypothetical protein